MKVAVSIIIPVYNRYHLIGETLDSIISQTYENWECIVVDDISTDYTREILSLYSEKDRRIKFFVRPSSMIKGADSCRNYGFSKSTGDYVNWFDSDDIMEKSYLQKQFNSIKNANFDCSVCNSVVFKSKPENFYFTLNNQSTSEKILQDYITGQINLGVHGILWSRKVVQKYKFDNNLYWAEELDLFFRIFKEKQLRVAFIDESLIFLRRHNSSLTGEYSRFNEKSISSELKVRRKILHHIYSSEFENEVLEKALNMYFKGFKMLFLQMQWTATRNEVRNLKNIFKLPSSIIFWEIKLFFLSVLFRLRVRKLNIHGHFCKFYTFVR